MDNDKITESNEAGEQRDSDFVQENAPRARNRTVMLTPEMTGQVRARLAQDPNAAGQGFLSGAGGPQDTRARGLTGFGADRGGFEPFQTASSVPGGLGSPTSSGAFARPQEQQYTQQQYSPPPAQTIQSGVPTANWGLPAPEVETPSRADEGVYYSKRSRVVGFLVSYDKDEDGKVFELRTGRLIVTSDPSVSGNLLYVNDETVSPMHAVLRISSSGEIQLLDQLSEYGTKISRFGSEEVEELSGDKGTLEHGDVVMFGERKFYVCLLAIPEKA